MTQILYKRSSNKLAKWWFALDHNIIFALLLLAAFGLIMSFSASPYVAERIGLNSSYFYTKHLFFLVLALMIAIVTSLFSAQQIRVLSLLGFLGALCLVFMVLFMSAELKGAKRWLNIFGFSLQPSEFLKPFFIVLNAWFLSRKFVRQDYRYYTSSLVIFALTVCGLVLQPDIGMTLGFCAVWAVQIFLAALPYIVVLLLALLGLVAVLVLYFSFAHVRFRIDMFLFSGDRPTYQVEKSLEAIRSGGLWGKGLFEGEVKTTLPDAHTDFIFAAMFEELGLIMSFVVLAGYFFIFYRIWLKFKFSEDQFAKLVLAGIAMQLAFQILVNVGGNLNLVPTKGTTLPLLSYGGSAMLATGILFGILLKFTQDNFGHYKRNQ